METHTFVYIDVGRNPHNCAEPFCELDCRRLSSEMATVECLASTTNANKTHTVWMMTYVCPLGIHVEV